MYIVMLGLSHGTAPVHVRERVAFAERDLPASLNRLFARPGIYEAAILSTCNRTEIYVVATDAARGRAEVGHFLMEDKGLDRQLLEDHCYAYDGRDAVVHLFRVAGGLESLIMGEGQILGQVKEAHALAQLHRTLGNVLDNLFKHAISAGKLVRSQTEISRGAVSVSSAAIALAKQELDGLQGKTILILGSGKMSELAAKQLLEDGVGRILVANRTIEAAEALAERFGGTAVPFHDLAGPLRAADLVICCTGAPHYVLEAPDLAAIGEVGRPRVFLDISMPRNIDPEVARLPGVRLYGLDDLQAVALANRAERQHCADEAALLLESEVGRFQTWLRSFRMSPTISSLRHKVEETRAQEFERFSAAALQRKFGSPLTPEQLRAVEELTRSITSKLLHGPTTELKGMAPVEQQQAASIVQHLFGLKVEEIGEHYLRKLRERTGNGECGLREVQAGDR